MSKEVEKHIRHLPHWHLDGFAYHIVFRSKIGELHPAMRQEVVNTIRYGEGKRFRIYVGVVMPDHVHLLLQPLENDTGETHSLSGILKAIKGTSAHKINRLMNTTGQVWQDESYDHIIRNEKEFNDQAAYIFLNPVRQGLVAGPNRLSVFGYTAIVVLYVGQALLPVHHRKNKK